MSPQTSPAAAKLVPSCRQSRRAQPVGQPDELADCTVEGAWTLSVTDHVLSGTWAPSISGYSFRIELEEDGQYWMDIPHNSPWDRWQAREGLGTCTITASGSDSVVDLSVAPPNSTCGLRSWHDTLELTVVDETTATGKRTFTETLGCMGQGIAEDEVAATRPAAG